MSASTAQECDQAFIRVLESTHNCDISLNSRNMQFKQASIDFCGQTLTEKGIQLAAGKLDEFNNLKVPIQCEGSSDHHRHCSYINILSD